jgi:nitrate reductase NapAB chaperone NapD
MALLIVAALVVIVTTIYNRLTNSKSIEAVIENTRTIPAGTHISGASASDKGGLVVVIDGESNQAIWQLDASGKITRKTDIVAGN